jgi:predicted ATPase/DNA-binding winged helix-turn-helix (wHTH) protein
MTSESAPGETDEVRFGPFRLNAAARLLLRDDKPVPLGGRALDILIALVQHAGEVLSRRELMKRVWPDVIVEEANLRIHIADLRKALGDGREGARFITNVPGRGYCFVAPIQRRRSALAAAASAPVESLGTHVIPTKLQRMVGRDETVRELCAQLACERMVSIVGPGGLGKTTVAIAVAHELSGEPESSICFADLDALDDESLVVPSVASAVGCLVQSQSSISGLTAWLADRRMLLILDNCEHVIEVAAALTDSLIRGAPSVRILATSREALRVEGESVYLLQPLANPSESIAATAKDAISSAAVQLFMERAAAGGHRQPLQDEEAPVVARICRQLDGIPLAIELAASRVGAYGIRGLAEMIEDRMALLWQGRRRMPRHQTLRSALDWSYKLLSEDEASVLCRLSVFVGTFNLPAVRAVVGEPGDDVWRIPDVIASLVDKSLVALDPLGGDGSHRLLNTTRTYAAARLAERGEENTTARKHALYYLDYVREVEAVPASAGNAERSAWPRQIGNITAALDWSLSPAGDVGIAMSLSAGAVPLFPRLSMVTECCHWCRRALSAMPQDCRGTKIELVLQQSLAMASTYAYGNSVEVRDALERGLTLAEALDERAHKLHLLTGLNLYMTRGGDFRAALSAAKRCAEVAQQGGVSQEIVIAEWLLGVSHHLLGDQAAAQRFYEDGFRHAGAGQSEVEYFGYDHRMRALVGYARTMWFRGLADQAMRLAAQSIELARSRGHPVNFCMCGVSLLPIFVELVDQHTAEDLIAQFADCARKHSLAPYVTGIEGIRGQLLVTRGETALGIKLLRHAVTTLRTEQQWIRGTPLARVLAESLARQGQVDEAARIIDELLAEQSTGTYDVPELLRVRAVIMLASSPANPDAAEASLKSALESARAQSALALELRSATMLARLWADRQQTDNALQLLVEVQQRFSEGLDSADMRDASRLILDLKGRAERTPAAL